MLQSTVVSEEIIEIQSRVCTVLSRGHDLYMIIKYVNHFWEYLLATSRDIEILFSALLFIGNQWNIL